MTALADLVKDLADLSKVRADVSQLQTESIRLSTDVKELKDSASKASKIEREYKRLEAWLSAAKFAALVIAVWSVFAFHGDNLARLFRPITPSLEARVALFTGEHDATSAHQYLGECAKALQSIQTSIAPTAQPPTTAPAVSPASSPAAAPQPALAPPTVPSAASATRRPLKLGQGQVKRLREACGELLGE